MRAGTSLPKVGAAPHRPAGHFSPYSDGKKEADREGGACLATLVTGEAGDDCAPLPVSIRGEDAGRQVRGGADRNDWRFGSGCWLKPTTLRPGVTKNGA